MGQASSRRLPLAPKTKNYDNNKDTTEIQGFDGYN